VAAQLAEQLLQVGQEIAWRWLMPDKRDRTLALAQARSIIAVTAKRPFVVRRIHPRSTGLGNIAAFQLLKPRVVE
jgi:hypothetical protein